MKVLFYISKFDYYKNSLKLLKNAPQQDLNNEFIISGIIDKFSLQFELGWKVLKELLLYEGVSAGKTGSPREIIKAAYQTFDFIHEEVWLSMLKERNDTSHIYDGNAAKKLVKKILEDYIGEFAQMEEKIEEKYKNR